MFKQVKENAVVLMLSETYLDKSKLSLKYLHDYFYDSTCNSVDVVNFFQPGKAKMLYCGDDELVTLVLLAAGSTI